MKLGGLVESAGGDLGVRFNIVGLLPTVTFVLFVLLAVASGALSGAPDLERAVAAASALGTKDTVLLGLGVLILALLLQPVQLPLVRTLEGYWGATRPLSWLAERRRASHRAVRAELEFDLQGVLDEGASGLAKERAQAAARKLASRYPATDRMMPTALGNALRVAEDRPAERYGLDAVVVWPRLHPLVSERLSALLEDQRNQLDMAARFAVVFAVIAILAFALVVKAAFVGGVTASGLRWLAAPAIAVVLAWTSYRAAISAAVAYGEFVSTAFDLHRFDLVKSMRLRLPPNGEVEQDDNRIISDFLRQGASSQFNYTDEHELRASGD